MRKNQNLAVALVLALGLVATACSKKNEGTKVVEATETAEVAQSSAAEMTEEDIAAAQKKAAIAFALMEDQIKSDPNGQWAVDARASSTYASNLENKQADYHPYQATGMPNVESYGDVGTAWATKTDGAGIEWLELDYAQPVNATAIKIRQNNAPGAIISVGVFDEAGKLHNVWQGPDETRYEPKISWLNISFEKTTFKTQRIKITLATNAVSGWNEIDAVQLIGEQ